MWTDFFVRNAYVKHRRKLMFAVFLRVETLIHVVVCVISSLRCISVVYVDKKKKLMTS